MLVRRIVLGVLLLVWCTAARAADAPRPPGDRDVFRKPLGGDRELVVVRGPAVSPDVLRGLLAPRLADAPDQWASVCSLRVELRSPGQPPLVLQSCVSVESNRPGDVSFDVLDVRVEPGTITVATAEGAHVYLWQIGVLWPSGPLTALKSADWSPYAATAALDRTTVSVTLRRTGNGKLTVEVVDKQMVSPRYPHTLFEQVEGKWEFKPIKQWAAEDTGGVMTGPSTAPSRPADAARPQPR